MATITIHTRTRKTAIKVIKMIANEQGLNLTDWGVCAFGYRMTATMNDDFTIEVTSSILSVDTLIYEVKQVTKAKIS